MFIQHQIYIRLNSTGFNGADVDILLPDFITERETCVALTWYPSGNGPESFSILLTISAAIGVVASAFLKSLGEDLYVWSKQKLKESLKSKRYPNCYIEIKFNDVTIYFHEDELFANPDAVEVISNLFEKIPSLLKHVEAEKSEKWVIYRKEIEGALTIESEEAYFVKN